MQDLTPALRGPSRRGGAAGRPCGRGRYRGRPHLQSGPLLAEGTARRVSAILAPAHPVCRLGPGRGYKCIASEGPHPRVHLFALPEAEVVAHSEEHLVVATPRADAFAVGDCFYGAPWHICPTVALHGHAVVVKGGRAEERWAVAARERVLTV